MINDSFLCLEYYLVFTVHVFAVVMHILWFCKIFSCHFDFSCYFAKKIVVLVLAFNLFLGGVGQMYKNAVFVLKNQYNY